MRRRSGITTWDRRDLNASLGITNTLRPNREIGTSHDQRQTAEV